MQPIPRFEWQTFGMLACCYGWMALSVTLLPQYSYPLSFLALALGMALHSSLQHEALHGHPTRNPVLNEAFVFLPVGLFVPYRRFRDTHLAHHNDESLTDPYDDPETNFLDPKIWAGLSNPVKILRRINNALLGRILLGPAISIHAMIKADLHAIRRGEAGVLRGWLLHFAGFVPLFWLLATFSNLPFWVYVLAAYFAYGLLKIRTYLEHRAHESATGRSVVIEDRGLLSLLFLNNNFHIVHHKNPGAPWYRLPGLYVKSRAQYLEMNDGYRYRNYAEIFRRYFFRAKDPVPHPLWKAD